MGSDLRFAIRLITRAPLFSAIVILTLALGIGANAAIFGVINGLILRPLPVAEPERLATISTPFAIDRGYTAGLGWSRGMWDRFQPHLPLFDGAIAWTMDRFDLAQGGEMQPVDALFVGGTYFGMLGIRPQIGRLLTESDDRSGGGVDGPVAIISDRLWQRRFGRAPSALGAPLIIDGTSVTIVGVTPPDFDGLEVGRTFDLALPLAAGPLVGTNRSAFAQRPLVVMLRLKRGQSLAAGTALVRGIQPQILDTNADPRANAPWLKEPFTLVSASTGTSGATMNHNGLRQAYQRPLVTILIVVLVVLLIACVNLANLLTARGTARRHEMTVRLALGATRAQLARQLFLESLLLAGLGAALGLAVGAWGSRALVSQLSTSMDAVALNLTPDWRVIAFTAIAAIATATLVGTAPALHAVRLAPLDALRTHSRTSPYGRSRLSTALVVFQMALSLALVVAAGLFLRTFEKLSHVPLGFDPDRVLLMSVDVRRAHTGDVSALYQRIVETVRALPGVAAAGGSPWTPVDGGLRMADPQRRIAFNFVTPGWFDAYQTPIRAGRDFTAADSADAAAVVIVNDAFVRTQLQGRSPVGETMAYPNLRDRRVQRRIVGVVGDAVFDSQRDGTQPIVYLPLAQAGPFTPQGHPAIGLGIRPVAGSPMLLTRDIASALGALDPGLTFSFRPLRDQVDASVTRERVVARLSGIFGGLALLLAALGLYGITSYAVSRRTIEIGIRMALGAQRSSVLGLILSRSLGLTAASVALGLGGAAATTRYLRSMLFGLTPLDPATFGGVAVLFILVATVAALVPARRATRIDPMTVLRGE